MNIKETKNQQKNIDKEVFKRINDKFKQYWKVLFTLITCYIVGYLCWSIGAEKIRDLLKKNNLNKGVLFFVISIALLQGLLFSLDGVVTSLLKAPFNQMCYAINKAERIDDKKKDYVITKATESNEHCKETLKKFGILTIGAEVVKVLIKGKNLQDEDAGRYGQWLMISYLVPLVWATIDILLINRELKKVKKGLFSITSIPKK